MSDNEYGMFDDGPTDDQLATVVTLAERQVQLEDHVASLQAQLEKAISALRAIQEHDLPESMSLAGIDSFKLSGDRQVKVDTKIFARPLVEQKPEVHRWLEENNFADIIKHEIKASFGRGEQAKAGELLAWLSEHLPRTKVENKESVHPGTLDAFAREQMARQVDLPEAFGVVVLKKTTIVRPKTEPTI